MAVEGGIFLANPPAPTPRPSPAGSDSLSPLSSHSATPPSTPEVNDPKKEVATRDPRKQAAIARWTQTILDPSGADGPLQSQEAAPERFVWRAPILGRGTPLRPAAPLLGTVATAVPLPGTVTTAAPLPGTVATAVPLPGTVATAAPLPGMVATAAPLPGMVATAAPLPEEQAPLACFPPGATPQSEGGEPECSSPVEPVSKEAVIKPARPEDFWLVKDGASGPLPSEPEDPAPPQIDVVTSTDRSLPETRPVGPAPLAIPESSEISPIASPRQLGDASGASIGEPCSPAQARVGRPSVAEVLQQRVVCEQIVTTMVEQEETIEQYLLETETEPMVISGGNTPVAPDDAELDLEEESEQLMDETCL